MKSSHKKLNCHSYVMDNSYNFFSDVKVQDLKVSLELKTRYILYNILHILHIGLNRLLLLTENAFMKRCQKFWARHSPPPLIWTKSKRTVFFRESVPYISYVHRRSSAVQRLETNGFSDCCAVKSKL